MRFRQVSTTLPVAPSDMAIGTNEDARAVQMAQAIRQQAAEPIRVRNTGEGVAVLAAGALGGLMEGMARRKAEERARMAAGEAARVLAPALGLSPEQTTALFIANPQIAQAALAKYMESRATPQDRFRVENRDGIEYQINERNNEQRILRDRPSLVPVKPGEMLADPDAARLSQIPGGPPVAPGAANPASPPRPPGLVFQAPGGYTPLVSPEERRAAGIRDDDKGIYQRGPEGRLSAVGTPQQNTTINNVQNPILRGIGEQFVEQRTAAGAARQTIGSIHEARALVDAGITTGIGAERRLDMQRVGALFGISDPATVANTEAFRAVMGRGVLAEIRTLGANPSNADREYLERVVAGNIDLNENTIRRVLEIRENAARQSIRDFNLNADRMAGTMPELQQFRGALAVQEPPSYEEFLASRQPAQQQGGPPPVQPTMPPPQAAAPDVGDPSPPPRPQPGPLDMARDAIMRGAPPDAVFKRLQDNGFDPRPLFEMMPGPPMPPGMQ